MEPIKALVKGIADDGHLLTWTLHADDVGIPEGFSQYRQRIVQIAGIFGSGTVVVEGSNDLKDPEQWFPLHDGRGDLLSTLEPCLQEVWESPLWTRVRVEGGEEDTAIVVKLLVRR